MILTLKNPNENLNNHKTKTNENSKRIQNLHLEQQETFQIKESKQKYLTIKMNQINNQ